MPAQPSRSLRFRIPWAEGALQLLLDDPVVTVRGNAAFALAQIPAMDGGAALSLALASEDDPGVRDRLVSAIGRRGAPEAVVSLVGGEPDAPHRALWTLALAEGGIRGIRDEALVAALTDRLLDPDPEVRFAAGYYFGRVSTAGPWIDRAPLVRDALDGYRPDEPTAMYLVLGLARVGDPALDRDRLLHWLANGEDWRIRVGAADAVGNPRWLEDPVVVDALFRALADPVEHVRATAASAIGILIFSSPDARARAAAMMDGPAEEWRTQASFAQGLVAAGLTDMVRSWTERMAGGHPVAARLGIEALAAADGSDVTSRLFDLAGHPEPEVRAAALRILGQRWQREGGTSDTLQPYFELFRERIADEANLPAARAGGGAGESRIRALWVGGARSEHLPPTTAGRGPEPADPPGGSDGHALGAVPPGAARRLGLPGATGVPRSRSSDSRENPSSLPSWPLPTRSARSTGMRSPDWVGRPGWRWRRIAGRW